MSYNALGNKARNLIWLKDRINSVPDFIIIDPEVYIENYIELNSDLVSYIDQTNRTTQFKKTFEKARFNQVRLNKLTNELNRISTDRLIFRTSAEQEDLSSFSFAGIYSSFGPYKKTELELEKIILECWQSLYSERSLNYLKFSRRAFGYQTFCIIAQSFFRGLFSGVAFVDYKKQAIILTIGAGEQAVVDGENGHTLELNFSDTDLPEILNGKIKHDVWQNFLNDLKLIAQQKESPQDIEWILNKTGFAIVQTRDITKAPSAKVTETVWDNTNIAESYPGVTLPLTFSFIRHAYSKVYPNFLELVGTPTTVINTKTHIFNNLLGHIHGYVYYNAHNWYEMIKLLPGYRFNKDFFEDMWNPKKKLPTEASKHSLIKNVALIPVLVKFLGKVIFIKSSINNFLLDFEKKLEDFSKIDMENMTLSELSAHYQATENSFFSAWSVPILNDFRVMIFHGILRQLIIPGKAKEQTDRIVSSLLTQEMALQSLAPIKAIIDLSGLCKQDKAIYKLLINGEDDTTILKYIQTNKNSHVIREGINEYIKKYGDRNPSELKLESPTMKDHPELIIGLIKQFLKYEPQNKLSTKDNHDKRYRDSLNVFRLLIAGKSKALYPILWPISKWILKSAQNAVATREHLRLLRSIAYGVARTMYDQFGVLFVQNNILDTKNDIFYLTREEILQIANSELLSVNPEINKRKTLFIKYKNNPAPARRITTFGYPDIKAIVADGNVNQQADQKVFKGIAASPGKVQGETLCLKEFDSNQNFSGKILVTKQTDPGWTTIFPLISGLITERGNILSHAAIVSRELNIPSVLAIDMITDILKTGDIVEVDGNLGIITKK